MNFFRSLLNLPILLLLFLSLSTQAADNTPAWLQPEVIKAAIAIQMTAEQSPLFKAAISDYLNGLTSAINKILKGRDMTNMERRIKRKNRFFLKKMDKAMAEFLTPEQIPKYEIYRDQLVKAMKP